MEQSPDLRAVYLRWLENLAAGTFSAPADFAWTGEGASLIGSAPDEWFTDVATTAAWEAILRAFGTSGLRLVPGDPNAYCEGAIGWVVDQTQLRSPSGAAVPTRLTAVFRRTDGGWQLVHAHHSVGVPNGQSEG